MTELARSGQFRLARRLAALPPAAAVRLSGGRAVTVDGQVLNPQIQVLLAARDRLRKRPPVATQTPREVRAGMVADSRAAAGPVPELAEITDLQVAGGAGPIPARAYVPREAGGPHPLLLFFHGGGFVAGNLDTHDAQCRLLAHHAGAVVLALDYRLAPEHPFPAGVEDAVAAFGWAVQHAGEVGADPRRVGVAGDSAGGNLAAVVAQQTRDSEARTPVAQVLVYPTVDVRHDWPSMAQFGAGFFLGADQVAWYHDHYLLPGTDETDPRVSPLHAPDLGGLPPALVVTAGFDPLRDEGEELAGRLAAAGTPVVLRRFPDLIHGFLHFAGLSPAARAASVEVAGAVRVLLRSAPV